MNNKKQSLIEMAMTISKYTLKIFSLYVQLAENFCLVYYATKYDHPCLKHWSDELRGHLKALRQLKLKSGNKEKILYRIIYEDWEFNTTDVILNFVVDKFEDEQIELKEEYAKHFCDCLPILIDCLSEKITVQQFFKFCFR